MQALIYAIDAAILALAAAAAISTVGLLGERIVRRRRLLAPGLLAAASAVLLLCYPDIHDLFQLELMSIAAAGLLAGVARGQFMRLDTDHNWNLVRLKWAYDWLLVAAGVLVLALGQFAIELRLRQENPFETTVELPVVLASAYLLGASLVVWIRAGTVAHSDLHD